MNVEKINDTITFVLWHLDQGRHDFGDVGMEWVGGLIQEIRRLRTIETESAHLTLVKSCQLCMIVVNRMCEQGLQTEVQPLEEYLRATAVNAHAQFTSQDLQDGKTFSRAYRQGLFLVLNNLACLEIERGKQAEAREIVKKAAALVRDDDPDAETFLLNAGSLIALERGNSSMLDSSKTSEAEAVMLRALQVAQKKFDAKQAEIQEFRTRHEEVHVT